MSAKGARGHIQVKHQCVNQAPLVTFPEFCASCCTAWGSSSRPRKRSTRCFTYSLTIARTGLELGVVVQNINVAGLLLLAAVEFVWWVGGAENVLVPLFWNAAFLVALYIIGRPLFRAIHLMIRPNTSEEVAYLRRFGPLADTVKQIEMELQHAIDAAGGEAVFTRTWLVVSRRSRFAVRRLDDLVWAFTRTTTTKLNWVIPIWRSHAVIFRSPHAPDAEAKISKDGSIALLEHTARRCPSIVLGYDEEREKRWQASKTVQG